MLKTFSISNITAGLVAVMVAYSSSIVIIFQAATAAGASASEISSWLLAIGIGMAVTCIGFSLHYRIPIFMGWSTPGAALLITSLVGVSMPEAIGAFIFSGLLIFLSGVTGIFEKTMKYIPRSITAAMLAGILLQFGINIFVALKTQSVLVIALCLTYLIGKRLFPRFVILLILILGITIANLRGLVHLDNFHMALSTPVFTMPVFSFPILLSVGIPLFIITMTSQNIPGIAVIRASGYTPAISPIISWSGITNILLAPFGCFSVNLAAITAAICLSKEADLDSTQRYKATIIGGLFYLLAGLFGASVVALISALPQELILTVAGLALLNTIASSLTIAMEDEFQREPALITLLVSCSGVTLFGIGGAFWGLIAGLLTFALMQVSPNTIFLKNFSIEKSLKLAFFKRSE